MLSKGCSKIYSLKSAQGTFDDLVAFSFIFLVSMFYNWRMENAG